MGVPAIDVRLGRVKGACMRSVALAERRGSGVSDEYGVNDSYLELCKVCLQIRVYPLQSQTQCATRRVFRSVFNLLTRQRCDPMQPALHPADLFSAVSLFRLIFVWMSHFVYKQSAGSGVTI